MSADRDRAWEWRAAMGHVLRSIYRPVFGRFHDDQNTQSAIASMSAAAKNISKVAKDLHPESSSGMGTKDADAIDEIARIMN